MRQSRLFRLLILALVVMMTVAPAAALQAQEDRVIRIGLNVPLTGPIALIGEGYRWGVTLAIEDLGGEIDGSSRPTTSATRLTPSTPPAAWLRWTRCMS